MESYESEKGFDSSPVLRFFKHNNLREEDGENMMVEVGRVLFTNAIVTVNLLPWIAFGVIGFAGFAFFLWLMGYDLVSFCSEFEY